LASGTADPGVRGAPSHGPKAVLGVDAREGVTPENF
jgi:hypothetical protein